jgi:hypothetical protein
MLPIIQLAQTHLFSFNLISFCAFEGKTLQGCHTNGTSLVTAGTAIIFTIQLLTTKLITMTLFILYLVSLVWMVVFLNNFIKPFKNQKQLGDSNIAGIVLEKSE